MARLENPQPPVMKMKIMLAPGAETKSYSVVGQILRCRWSVGDRTQRFTDGNVYLISWNKEKRHSLSGRRHIHSPFKDILMR
jgi:hypothetical protein